MTYPNAELPKITKSIKNYSARRANEILGLAGPFWQDESFDRWMRTPEEIGKTVRYIEESPVSAGLVSSVED